MPTAPVTSKLLPSVPSVSVAAEAVSAPLSHVTVPTLSTASVSVTSIPVCCTPLAPPSPLTIRSLTITAAALTCVATLSGVIARSSSVPVSTSACVASSMTPFRDSVDACTEALIAAGLAPLVCHLTLTSPAGAVGVVSLKLASVTLPLLTEMSSPPPPPAPARSAHSSPVVPMTIGSSVVSIQWVFSFAEPSETPTISAPRTSAS